MDDLLPDTVAPSLACLARLRRLVSAEPPTGTSLRAGGGAHRAPQRGRGIEFEELRDYRAGDDPRSIDWRVTARTGRTHTRVYREERERPLLLVTDLGPHMAFATRGSLKSALAARASALLAWRAAACGDRLGIFIAGGDGVHALRPARGDRAIQRALQALAQAARNALTPSPVAAANHLPDALAAVARTLRPGAHLCIVTDTAGADALDDALLVRLRRHADVALCVEDPIERALPAAGQLRFRFARSEFSLDGDNAATRARWQELQDERDARVATRMRRLGVRRILLATIGDDAALAAVLERQRAWN